MFFYKIEIDSKRQDELDLIRQYQNIPLELGTQSIKSRFSSIFW